jgi:hypothetical protein
MSFLSAHKPLVRAAVLTMFLGTGIGATLGVASAGSAGHGAQSSCTNKFQGSPQQYNGNGGTAASGNQYASTCDGTASMNGNGGGGANGKPCAGCVGNADNKNPKGQYPNGTDHNNGYECDGNNGVGKSNPAHTGCTTASPTYSPSPTMSPGAR